MVRTSHISRSLLVTTSATAAALFAMAPAHATTTCTPGSVTVSGTTETPTTISNCIITSETVPNDSVTLDNTTVVSTPGTIVLNPLGAGLGDGAITFANAGALGSTGSPVGVDLRGVGIKNAANTLVATNSGLITDSFLGGDFGVFGGNVSIANSGTVDGRIVGAGFGNVTVTNAAGGVAQGNGTTVYALAEQDTVAGVTSSGTATAQLDGKLVDAAGTGRSDAIAVSGNAATVNANSLAGNVTADAVQQFNSGTGDNTFVSKVTAAAPSSTVTTLQQSQTFTAGAATVAVGATGDVTGVTALGDSSATVTLAAGGKVGGNGINATSGIDANTTATNTQTQNATKTTQLTSLSTTNSGLGVTTVTLASGSTVGGDVNALAGNTATVNSAAKVTGNVFAHAYGATSSNNLVQNFDGTTGNLANQTVTNINNATAGAAGVTVSGGSVSGDVTATSDGPGGATVALTAGTVGGSVNANSVGTNTSSITTGTYDPTGSFTIAGTSTNTQTASGGTAAVTLAAGTKVAGDVNATSDGAASVSNAGRIAGDVNIDSSRILNGGATAFDSTKGTGSFDFNFQTVGSTGAFTNQTSGIVQGDATITALGNVTVANNGLVLGTTDATSTGGSSDFKITTASNKVSASGINTTTNTNTLAFTEASTGGSVNGTYAGTNGALNFIGGTDGSVTQTADIASTANVTGAVFGNLTSQGGQGTTLSIQGTQTDIRAVDKTKTGTDTGSQNSTIVATAGTNGTSTVSISGKVATGASFQNGDVASLATQTAGLTVSGSVSGSGTVSAAGVSNSTTTDTLAYAQTVTKGVSVTDTATETSNSATTLGGGDAVSMVTGSIASNLDVSGVTSANATVAGFVGGDLSVSAAGNDSFDNVQGTYSRDKVTGIATAQITETQSVGGSYPAVAGGNAAATVSGAVIGSIDVNSSRGNATVNLTGTAGDSVTANAFGTASTQTTVTNYAGLDNTNGHSVLGAPFQSSVSLPAETSQTFTQTDALTGGTGTVNINPNSKVIAGGEYAVNGNVNAYGLVAANANIGAGARINGDVNAESDDMNHSFTTTTTFDAVGNPATVTSTDQSTHAGGDATINNAGSAYYLYAGGDKTATVTNSGTAFSGAEAYSLGQDTTVTYSSTNNSDPATRVDVTTTTYTPYGGTATLTNTASGVVLGDVYVAGQTGLLTNNGVITGTSYLGDRVQAGTEVRTDTVGTTTTSTDTPTITTPLFVQTYTVQQNGVSGGFDVYGATVDYTNPGTLVTTPIQTSQINATINLNNGSVTLGDITAQTDPATGAKQTNTVVNLNGGGYLGLDWYGSPAVKIATATPEAALSVPTANLFGLSPSDGTGYAGYGVNVTGVTALNKTGAGTFVIVGNAGAPADTVGGVPHWTLDVGNFNINAGEVQLDVVPHAYSMGGGGIDTASLSSVSFTPPSSATPFTVNGNITNAATLVVGRRLPTVIPLFSTNLTTPGPEVIQGLTVNETGNFTQTAAGTLVVGIAPALVRLTTTLNGSSTTNEPLGALSPATTVYYFSTPSKLGCGPMVQSCPISSPSLVNVTGNVNLAGKVAVDLTNNGLYSNGDSSVLFTYTGTGTTTAAVTTNLGNSPFVNFALKNDTTAKTISLVTTRTSYGKFSGISGDANAQSAAVGFDSALVSSIAAIKVGNFPSATALANVQDVANIASLLDFGLTDAQRTEVFTELSSGEFYGSLAAIDQNVAFISPLQQMNVEQAAGDDLGTGLWITPSGNWARYSANQESGASAVHDDTVGIAGGFTAAYAPDGAIGIGFSYGRHKVHAQPNTEEALVHSYTAGIYATQAFGPLYVNAQLEYGWSDFNTTRTLQLLARRYTGEFSGNQLDGKLEVGYNLAMGAAVVTPFANVDIRHFKLDGFTEQGPGGIALNVNEQSKTYIMPTAGVRVAGTVGDAGNFVLRPYGQASVTFNGGKGTDRTMSFVGGGSDFTVVGVNGSTYGTVELGLDASTQTGLSFFLAGGYSFGSDYKNANIRGGLRINFGGRPAPAPAPVYAAPPPAPVYTPAPAPAPLPAPAPAPVLRPGERG